MKKFNIKLGQKRPINENVFKDFIDDIKKDFISIGTEFKKDLKEMFDETKETGKQIQKDAQEIIDDAVKKLDELKKGYQDKVNENNIPSGTDKNLNLFEDGDITVEKAKSELTDDEFNTFNTLIRLGDSIELAYSTVIKDRGKEDSSEFYRQAYED